MRRFGQHAVLKEEKVADYVRLHSAVWPEVLQTINDFHLHNYSIYRSGCEVFSYFEYTGEDYEADMAAMDHNAKMIEWWKLTKPCFERHDKNEYYIDWEEIFYLP